MTEQQRFYIDHGMIHDRATGRHVTTDPTMYVHDENGEPMPDRPVYRQSDIVDCCNLLNHLADNQAKPLEEQGCVQCNPIKRRKVIGDPCKGVMWPSVNQDATTKGRVVAQKEG